MCKACGSQNAVNGYLFQSLPDLHIKQRWVQMRQHAANIECSMTEASQAPTLRTLQKYGLWLYLSPYTHISGGQVPCPAQRGRACRTMSRIRRSAREAVIPSCPRFACHLSESCDPRIPTVYVCIPTFHAGRSLLRLYHLECIHGGTAHACHSVW